MSARSRDPAYRGRGEGSTTKVSACVAASGGIIGRLPIDRSRTQDMDETLLLINRGERMPSLSDMNVRRCRCLAILFVVAFWSTHCVAAMSGHPSPGSSGLEFLDDRYSRSAAAENTALPALLAQSSTADPAVDAQNNPPEGGTRRSVKKDTEEIWYKRVAF